MAMCEANGEILLFVNAKGNQESERVASIDDEDRVRAVSRMGYGVGEESI